jgi:hypothetical protein
MAEIEMQVNLTLVAICVGLLLLLVVVGMISRIAKRLSRIESLITSDRSRGEAVERIPGEAETSGGGAFEAFLADDPERRLLTKGEQFAAYRQWRQENGMNWSNS